MWLSDSLIATASKEILERIFGLGRQEIVTDNLTVQNEHLGDPLAHPIHFIDASQ